MIDFYQLQVLINNVDRTDDILWKTFSIDDEINENPNILYFDLNIYANKTYTPVVGDDISVSFNNNVYFSGRIISIDNSGDRYSEFVSITAKDNIILLDNILITKRYANTTVNAIIADIIADDRFENEVTDTNVDANITIKSIVFNTLSVTKCLQKLADYTGYNWYIDENKDIHFFAVNTEKAPFGLNNVDDNYIENSLTYNLDITQLKNFIKVRGGDKVSSVTKTHTEFGNGVTTEIQTVLQYSSLPTITVGGVAQTVGIMYLNLPTEDFDCFWSMSERKVNFKVAPGDGVAIVFNGYVLEPIIIQVEDTASKSRYHLAEFTAEDKGIKSIEEAQQYGDALLQAYSKPILEVEFSTYKQGLRSGQNLSIDTRGIFDTYVIQSVEMTIMCCKLGAFEKLQDVSYNDIVTNESEEIYINAGNSGALVFPIFKVKCSNTNNSNLATFLQNLLLKDNLKTDIDDDLPLDILNVDRQNVGIYDIVERINHDIFFTLYGHVILDPLTDPYRDGLLDISFRVY